MLDALRVSKLQTSATHLLDQANLIYLLIRKTKTSCSW